MGMEENKKGRPPKPPDEHRPWSSVSLAPEEWQYLREGKKNGDWKSISAGISLAIQAHRDHVSASKE